MDRLALGCWVKRTSYLTHLPESGPPRTDSAGPVDDWATTTEFPSGPKVAPSLQPEPLFLPCRSSQGYFKPLRHNY